MDLQEKIEALEKEFNEKIKTLKAEAQQADEFPQDGDEYWFIDSTGDVLNSNWESLSFEIDRLEFGHIFKTKEQARFAVEKLKVEAELRKFSRPFKGDNKNYCIELCYPYEKVTIYSYEQFRIQGVIYFEGREKAQQAIQSVGEERIKKYLFGVED